MTLTPEYDRLFIDKQSPDVYRSMSVVAGEVTATAEAAGLDRLLIELVNIRVSQLNGCGFCLDLHVRRAVKNGEHYFSDPNIRDEYQATDVMTAQRAIRFLRVRQVAQAQAGHGELHAGAA